MPLYKIQVGVAADTLFAYDRIVNTLHMNDRGLGTNPGSIASQVADAFWNTWMAGAPNRETLVSVYQVGSPPNLPVAQHRRHLGLAAATDQPRELACCLSYYNERSNPRKRGRMFLSPALTTSGTGVARPSNFMMGKALDLGDALAAVGGPDVDWVVYSPTNNAHYEVVGTWCDNAWDVIRSRGLSANNRLARTPGP